MLSPKKVRLILLAPALAAVLVLAGCKKCETDTTKKGKQVKQTEKVERRKGR